MKLYAFCLTALKQLCNKNRIVGQNFFLAPFPLMGLNGVMTLSKYLAREGSPSLTKLAAKMGITKGRLSQLRDSTEWPPELALEAEKQTGGALDAGILSPTVARARQAAA